MRQLTIYDVARLAVAYWTRDDAITMVAIAGPESAYIEDRPSSSDIIGMYGDQEAWHPYACDGVYSWGLWQVFMPVHHLLLQERTGSTDPCVWRDHLVDPGFNAILAHEIWATQGLSAWSTYNNGDYLDYLDEAEAAVDAALVPLPPRGPVTPGGISPPNLAIEPPWLAVEPPGQAVQPP